MVGRASRGVILVHVLILTMLLAWLAAMFLSSVLSRQMNARVSMNSNDTRGAMSAAAARLTSCLGSQAPPVNSCAYTSVSGCLGTMSVGSGAAARPFNYTICSTPAIPPCRFRIAVCQAGAASCAAPSPSCP